MHLSQLPLTSAVLKPVRDYLNSKKVLAPELLGKIQSHLAYDRITHAAWWSILEDVHGVLPYPETMFEIGDYLRISHLGIFGYLLSTSSSLAEAASRGQRYLPLLHQSDTVELSLSGHAVCVAWSKSFGDSHRLSDELYFSGIQKFVRLVTGKRDFSFQRIEFRHSEPKNSAIYAEVFNCEVLFDRPLLKIFIPLDLLSVPLKDADPNIVALIERQSVALLNNLPKSDDFLEQLERLLIVGLQDGVTTAEKYADKLEISRRTLYRRLQDRGLDFSQLIRTVRIKLAEDYLKDAQLSFGEIALLLGYSDQTTFNRAFKSWNGESPGSFRARLRNAY